MKHIKDFAEVVLFTVTACAILTLAVTLCNPLNINYWGVFFKSMLVCVPACLVITLLATQ